LRAMRRAHIPRELRSLIETDTGPWAEGMHGTRLDAKAAVDAIQGRASLDRVTPTSSELWGFVRTPRLTPNQLIRSSSLVSDMFGGYCCYRAQRIE
jgi:hypothetical protein